MGGSSKVLPSWKCSRVTSRGRCHLTAQLFQSMVQAWQDNQNCLLTLDAPYAGGTTSSQWVRIGPPFLKGMLQGPAIGSSCHFVRVGEGRCKRWKVPGEFPCVITLTKIHRASQPGTCLGRSYLWVQDIWVASAGFSSVLRGLHS